MYFGGILIYKILVGCIIGSKEAMKQKIGVFKKMALGNPDLCLDKICPYLDPDLPSG
jgi:hypothetical protein